MQNAECKMQNAKFRKHEGASFQRFQTHHSSVSKRIIPAKAGIQLFVPQGVLPLR